MARAEIVTAEDLDWTDLNPARGDASPRAATLWGDRAGDGASGFLVKFADGFESPPHIHNVSYRAFVLTGSVFNEDVDAPRSWMGPGSFWTQPAGDAHITASQGESMVYVEIDSGPYLVRPVDQAFDNGETPVNLHAERIEWRAGDEIGWADAPPGLEVASLWESQSKRGLFIRCEDGCQFGLRATQRLRIVVVQGTAEARKTLERGAFIGTTQVEVEAEPSTTLYLRAADMPEIVPPP